jgi:hypothetical protein
VTVIGVSPASASTCYPESSMASLGEPSGEGTALLPCLGSPGDQRSRFLAYGSEQQVRADEASSQQDTHVSRDAAW